MRLKTFQYILNAKQNRATYFSLHLNFKKFKQRQNISIVTLKWRKKWEEQEQKEHSSKMEISRLVGVVCGTHRHTHMRTPNTLPKCEDHQNGQKNICYANFVLCSKFSQYLKQHQEQQTFEREREKKKATKKLSPENFVCVQKCMENIWLNVS